MDHRLIIDHLSVNSDVFRDLFSNLTEHQARWKPGADRWSLLEVINHLLDEEREDFRQRLSLVLENTEKQWPAIDPENWVIQRRYNQKDLSASLAHFTAERSRTIEWLNGLKDPDWQAVHHHPIMGNMSAELLLANWLAHDLFHIRQVNDLCVAYLKMKVSPVPLKYSGWD